MSDFYDAVGHGNALHGGQNARSVARQRSLFHTGAQQPDQGCINSFTMPSSSSVFPDQIYTFQDHQDTCIASDTAPRQPYNLVPIQALQIDCPYYQPISTAESPYILSGNTVSMFEESRDRMNTGPGFKAIDKQGPDHRTAVSAMQDSHPAQASSMWSCKPYARLIYEALKAAPGHRMVLKEIYQWFERHTDKPITSNNSGWKNSIRHNLSMNAAFEKVEARSDGDDGKKTYIWALSAQALVHNGVESTTRYRKIAAKKSNQFHHRDRVVKKKRRLPTSPRSLFKSELGHENSVIDVPVHVKEERHSQDFTPGSHHRPSGWTFQHYFHHDPSQFPTSTVNWDDRFASMNMANNYHTMDWHPTMDAARPLFDYIHHNRHANLQRTTSDMDMRYSDPPTPSMTTGQSPLGSHEENEFDLAQCSNHHPFGFFEDSQPRKVFDHQHHSAD